MTKQINLLPCPFCGGEAMYGIHFGSSYIQCTGCGVITKCYGEKQFRELNDIAAAEAWNRRHSDEA